MGVGFGMSKCSGDEHKGDSADWERRYWEQQAAQRRLAGNPDPKVFSIVRTEQVRGMLVVMLVYPNCTNYEGRKILVYEDYKEDDFRRRREIDPHFCDGCVAPVARFKPTDDGWRMAVAFCKAWKERPPRGPK